MIVQRQQRQHINKKNNNITMVLGKNKYRTNSLPQAKEDLHCTHVKDTANKEVCLPSSETGQKKRQEIRRGNNNRKEKKGKKGMHHNTAVEEKSTVAHGHLSACCCNMFPLRVGRQPSRRT